MNPGGDRRDHHDDGLRHPLLEAIGVAHGFGLRGTVPPSKVRRPRQVHGTHVVEASASNDDALGDADAVVTADPGLAIGVVTADCVPVLVAAAGGRVVAAVHAGWRGLAAGVIGSAFDALARHAPVRGGWLAVVGPHVGSCCYEVDAPVLAALAERFGARLRPALVPTRPGHARLDLGRLVRADLQGVGVPVPGIGRIEGTCTACQADRFHSYRRDGEAAGRMLHWISARRPEECGLDTPGASP